MSEEFTKEEALDFFAEVLGGRHHVPELKEWGQGWKIYSEHCLSTFDGDLLTRLVWAAHRYLYRIEILPCNFRYVNIIVNKRLGPVSNKELDFYSKHRDVKEMIRDMESRCNKCGARKYEKNGR